MNKVINTNIGGQIFHIEEDAYELLNNYLTSVRKTFNSSEEEKEIMADIEARIAELLKQKLNDSNQVTTKIHIENVSGIMGRPEDFSDSENTTETSQKEAYTKTVNKNARTFRDPDNRVVGGVCSGISHHFDIDPLWLRLAFAIAFLSFGTGLLIYIILWMAIPKAKTTAEKLEMKRENVDINNIKKSVSKNTMKATTSFTNSVDTLVSLMKMAGTVCLKVLAFISIFFGIIGIAILVLSFIVGSFMYPIIFSEANSLFAKIGISLIILIPSISWIYLGVRILRPSYNTKHNRYVSFAAPILFIIGIIFIATAGISTMKEFTEVAEYKMNQNIVSNDKKIVISTSNHDNKRHTTFSSNGVFIAGRGFYFRNNVINSNNISLSLLPSSTDSIEIEVISSARGLTYNDAYERAKKITYQVHKKDSVLAINPFLTIPNGEKWRKQKVQMIVRVPSTMKIFVTKEVEQLLPKSIDRKTLVNHTWQFVGDNLECTDCNEKTIIHTPMVEQEAWSWGDSSDEDCDNDESN